MKRTYKVLMCVGYTALLSAGIGEKSLLHHLEGVTDWGSSAIDHAEEERPLFLAAYTPPAWLRLPPYQSEQVFWDQAFSLQQKEGQWSVHFLLDTVDVIDNTGSVGVSFFCASGRTKATGGYDIRIDIDQTKERALLNVYDAVGNRLAGSLPLIESSLAPFLPWRDGMRQFYSIVIERRAEGCALLLIQHTKATMPAYQEPVASMVRLYARHERLYNRPHAYLDRPEHMRCLPLPLFHQAYNALWGGDGMYVAMAVRTGIIEVLAAN